MKAVIERSTNRAIYLFEDEDQTSISQDAGVGLMFVRKRGGSPGRAADINVTDHRIVTGVPDPESQGLPYVGGALAYSSDSSQWSVHNQTAYDEVLDRIEDERVTKRLGQSAAECSRRIFEKASANRQMNLASAASADLLDETMMGLWKMALGWVAQMRATWVPLAQGTDDIYDDENWPDLPEGVQSLLDNF